MDDAKQEPGFVLVALLIVMIPTVLIVCSFATTMVGRSNELTNEFSREVALLAAESGVDDAIHRARTGTLTSGTTYTRQIGLGQSFAVEPTWLGSDLINNDGDLLTDEPDEDVFQVVVTGSYRGEERRIAAYLGTIPLLPPIEAAVLTMDDRIDVDLDGSSRISGIDERIDGTPGAGPDLPGLAIAPPGTVAHLSSELTGSEAGMVDGLGGTPSLGSASTLDLPTLVAQLQNAANIVLTNSLYSNFDFGNASSNIVNITTRSGDVEFTGNTRGAGILVVTGDLTIRGTFRFDGVIIALGEVETGSAAAGLVRGALIHGPNGDRLELGGTSMIRYSSQAIGIANSLAGSSVAFNGWQEIAR